MLLIIYTETFRAQLRDVGGRTGMWPALYLSDADFLISRLSTVRGRQRVHGLQRWCCNDYRLLCGAGIVSGPQGNQATITLGREVNSLAALAKHAEDGLCLLCESATSCESSLCCSWPLCGISLKLCRNTDKLRNTRTVIIRPQKACRHTVACIGCRCGIATQEVFLSLPQDQGTREDMLRVHVAADSPDMIQTQDNVLAIIGPTY